MHEILSSLGNLQLLIIDDCGLSPVDADARRDLLEILEER
jgi:DNA replication protein DnaC